MWKIWYSIRLSSTTVKPNLTLTKEKNRANSLVFFFLLVLPSWESAWVLHTDVTYGCQNIQLGSLLSSRVQSTSQSQLSWVRVANNFIRTGRQSFSSHPFMRADARVCMCVHLLARFQEWKREEIGSWVQRKEIVHSWFFSLFLSIQFSPLRLKHNPPCKLRLRIYTCKCQLWGRRMLS